MFCVIELGLILLCEFSSAPKQVWSLQCSEAHSALPTGSCVLTQWDTSYVMVDCCSLWFFVFLFLAFNFFCFNDTFVTFSFSPLVLMFCWKSEMLVWNYSPACAAHVKQPLSYKCLVYTASLVTHISHNIIVTHVCMEVRQTHHLVLKHLVILRNILVLKDSPAMKWKSFENMWFGVLKP